MKRVESGYFTRASDMEVCQSTRRLMLVKLNEERREVARRARQ